MKVERAYELAYKFSGVLANKEVKNQLRVFRLFIEKKATENDLKKAVDIVDKIADTYTDDLDYNTCMVIKSCMEYGYSPLAINQIKVYSYKIYFM